MTIDVLVVVSGSSPVVGIINKVANGSCLSKTSLLVKTDRRVGAGIERSAGSTAVGNKSASRNELGKSNDTA